MRYSHTRSSPQYGAAALLVLGVSLFCLGDSHVAPNFSLRGIALIMAALFADAATSNWEEKRFFRIPVPVSNAEVIACSSLFSCAVSAAVMVATSELGPAWRYTTVNSHVVPLLVAASVSGYLSVSLVLLLIKHYGAANAETVKTLRKARALVGCRV